MDADAELRVQALDDQRRSLQDRRGVGGTLSWLELVQAEGDPTLPLYIDNFRQVSDAVEDHGPAVALLPEFGAGYQGDVNAHAARLNGRRIAVSQCFYLAPEVPAVIVLPASQPMTILGTVLHPLADGDVSRQLAGFRVESSLVGANWSTAVESRLASAGAGLISEIESREADALFDSLAVDASLAGPTGPWTDLAEWSIVRHGIGRFVLELEEPTWARYLRLRSPVPEGQGTSTRRRGW